MRYSPFIYELYSVESIRHEKTPKKNLILFLCAKYLVFLNNAFLYCSVLVTLTNNNRRNKGAYNSHRSQRYHNVTSSRSNPDLTKRRSAFLQSTHEPHFHSPTTNLHSRVLKKYVKTP